MVSGSGQARRWASWLVGGAALLAVGACFPSFDESRLDAGAALDGVSPCAALSDGEACDGGTCHGGSCCRGCWDGQQCLAGAETAACGTAGGACERCAAPTGSCDTGRCRTERAVVALAAASRHSCASDTLNTLWCWGSNGRGEVGAPSPPPPSPPVESAERPVQVAAGGWVEVAAGGATSPHSCAIHFRGSLWCWGDNQHGQLGLGTVDAGRLAPTVVDERVWSVVGAGEGFSCALRDDRSLWCWGRNDLGQLGVSGEARSVPTRVGIESDWRTLAVGETHACATDGADTVWCWGANDDGQLGRVAGATDRPGLVSNGTGFRAVAAGVKHSCAVRADGTLWCWGNNQKNQLGFVGPAQTEPKQVGTGTDWVSVSAGSEHSCAIDRERRLWCWGANENGQLGGDDSSESVSEPRRVGSRADWTLVRAGYRHGCAVTDNGILWCWGAGESFQHGLATRESVQVPTALLLAR